MLKSISPRMRIILAMSIWGSLGLFVRGIALTSMEIAFFRAFIGSVFLILISLVRREKINRKDLKKNSPALLISGIALGFNWIALFQAMKYTTISNATLSYYFAPVFIMIFSALLLKERMNRKNIICIFLAIIGLFLIMQTGDLESIGDFNHLKGVSYGLAGAVMYAGIVIANKYIEDLSGFHTTLIQLLISVIVLIPVVFFRNSIDFKAINMRSWLLILILGVVHTGFAYILYFSGIRYTSSQSVAMLSYIDPIVAIGVSTLFLGETMLIIQILGALLILGSAYVNEKTQIS